MRRTVHYGDAWHPTRQTPEWVAERLPFLHSYARDKGRDPKDITVSLKRALHFSDLGLDQGSGTLTTGALVGTTQQVIDDVKHCEDLGIHQVTYDFRTSNYQDCVRIIENLAGHVMPKFD